MSKPLFHPSRHGVTTSPDHDRTYRQQQNNSDQQETTFAKAQYTPDAESRAKRWAEKSPAPSVR